MAKKKLFGNQLDPKCETCANGKLSVDGQSVLCVRGGALPLTHSCRHFAYDPLRRIPKRRPVLGDYCAADFALDEPLTEKTAAVAEKEDAAPVIADQTLDHLLTYLGEHNTPDAETILSILSGTFHPNTEEDDIEIPEATHDTADEDEINALIEEHAVQASAALEPDDTPDIFQDLERLNMDNVPSFALSPINANETTDMQPIFTPADVPSQFLTLSKSAEDAPLEADDLLLFPTGSNLKTDTPSPNVFVALTDKG